MMMTSREKNYRDAQKNAETLRFMVQIVLPFMLVFSLIFGGIGGASIMYSIDHPQIHTTTRLS